MGAAHAKPRRAAAGLIPARDIGGRFPGGPRGLARQGRAQPVAFGHRPSQERMGRLADDAVVVRVEAGPVSGLAPANRSGSGRASARNDHLLVWLHQFDGSAPCCDLLFDQSLRVSQPHRLFRDDELKSLQTLSQADVLLG